MKNSKFKSILLSSALILGSIVPSYAAETEGNQVTLDGYTVMVDDYGNLLGDRGSLEGMDDESIAQMELWGLRVKLEYIKDKLTDEEREDFENRVKEYSEPGFSDYRKVMESHGDLNNLLISKSEDSKESASYEDNNKDLNVQTGRYITNDPEGNEAETVEIPDSVPVRNEKGETDESSDIPASIPEDNGAEVYEKDNKRELKIIGASAVALIVAFVVIKKTRDK